MTDYSRFLSPVGAQLTGSAIRRMGTVIARAADVVSFAPGYPAADVFPWAELQDIASSALGSRQANALQYGPTRGDRDLIDALVGLLAERGIHASHEEVLVTTGSQQGIDLIARVLVSPGDVVLVELPTFTGAIAAFQNAQARLVGVARDADGIDLDDLEAVWQRETAAGRRVKLLYAVPNFQNPTGQLLGLDRRRRLVDWANQRDVLVVEDDPYGSLYFEDRATAAETTPMKTADPEGRVLYLSSFSKTLAPGFRVGWMVAPATLMERFETAKQSVDLTSGILDQRIALEAVRQGVIARLAPTLRAAYRDKRAAMETALRETLADALDWQTPRGGFFLWATLRHGVTDDVLLARAIEHGVAFVAGSAFHVDGSGHDTIRLSFSAPSIDRIREGVSRLAKAVAAVRGLPAGPRTT